MTKFKAPENVCTLRLPKLDLDLVWALLRTNKSIDGLFMEKGGAGAHFEFVDGDCFAINGYNKQLRNYAPDSASSLIDLREARKAWGL